MIVMKKYPKESMQNIPDTMELDISYEKEKYSPKLFLCLFRDYQFWIIFLCCILRCYLHLFLKVWKKYLFVFLKSKKVYKYSRCPNNVLVKNARNGKPK